VCADARGAEKLGLNERQEGEVPSFILLLCKSHMKDISYLSYLDDVTEIGGL
jgi:hypothetical protein